MKKQMLLSILLLIPLVCNAQHYINGVWSVLPYPSMNGAYERTLSWGVISISRHSDLIIDLNSEPPTIEIVQFSLNNIISINETNSNTELIFNFSRGGFNTTMTCHFNPDGTMWIEPLSDGLTFFRTGRDQVYYKIDGPNIVFRKNHIATEDIHLHERADNTAPIVLIIPKNSAVHVLSSGTQSIIDGINGYWVRVLTDDGYFGWCFSGNLVEVCPP